MKLNKHLVNDGVGLVMFMFFLWYHFLEGDVAMAVVTLHL